jgi:hypothetical protein
MGFDWALFGSAVWGSGEDMSNNLELKLDEAARWEEQHDGAPCYVVYSKPDDKYITTERMPMFGEWYSSDGVRHGR